MKALVLTAIIIATIVAGLYLVLDNLFMDDDFDASAYEHGVPLALASLSLLATPYLHQRISGRQGRYSFTALPAEVERFDDYLLPTGVLFLYGVSFLSAVNGVAIVSIWLLGEVTAFYVTRLIAILDFVFLAVAHFLVGSWVGRRAASHPYQITIVVVVSYSIFAALTTVLFRGSFRILPFAFATVFYFLIALMRTWSGRRLRVTAYARYLLAFVSQEQRALAAEALYEQVLYLRMPRSDRDSGKADAGGEGMPPFPLQSLVNAPHSETGAEATRG